MKKVKGFSLLIFATGLIIPLTIINRKNVDEKYGNTETYWLHTARNIDVWANAEFKATWNKELVSAIEVNGQIIYPYSFGKIGETISEALQRNCELGTLNKRGKKLYKIINRIDPGHFEEL